MKLDKIKFAQVVAFIVDTMRTGFNDEAIRSLDNMIDIEVEPQHVYNATPADIDMLMHLMAQGTQKIEAIKLYRKLTGFGLKNSKDAVEKYWSTDKKYSYADLRSKMNTATWNVNDYAVIERFIKEL